MIVMKFGGSSVADGDRIKNVAGIIQSEKRPKVVVVSAMASAVRGALSKKSISPKHSPLIKWAISRSSLFPDRLMIRTSPCCMI